MNIQMKIGKNTREEFKYWDSLYGDRKGYIILIPGRPQPLCATESGKGKCHTICPYRREEGNRCSCPRY